MKRGGRRREPFMPARRRPGSQSRSAFTSRKAREREGLVGEWGYRLDRVRPLDTPHVETVALLERG